MNETNTLLDVSLQKAKSSEEPEQKCSVKHPQTKNEKKLLGTNCQFATKLTLLFDHSCILY